MKILHISDIHYGRSGQLDWIDTAMTAATEAGIKAGCELAIISGDSFDKAIHAHAPDFSALVSQVVWLADSMPVIILQGTQSHDRPGVLDVFKVMTSKHRIIIADEIGSDIVSGCFVACLPSINKADPEVMAEGAHAWTARQLSEIAKPKNDLPSVLITHGTVTGCTTESNYAMVSPDHEFSLENLASANYDAVMLGHIHRHQAWEGIRRPDGGVTTIAYAGSLARLVHGHNDPVGFLIWTLEAGKPATFEFHESPSRQLLEISFPGIPDMEDLREIAATAGPDDAVRVRWLIEEERAASIEKDAIRRMFDHAASIKLEPRIVPVTRVRADGINKAHSIHEKLKHWCETTETADCYERLATRLSLAESADSDAIVSKLTDRGN